MPWDRGQGRDTPPVSPAHSSENLQAFSALSVLSLPPLHKVYFAHVPSACAVSGAGDPWEQPPGDLMETGASSSHPTPDNHYISVREESNNAAEINKPACFLFQSEDKRGVCSAEQNSQALQGGQEKTWVFLILVWTKYFETGWA